MSCERRKRQGNTMYTVYYLCVRNVGNNKIYIARRINWKLMRLITYGGGWEQSRKYRTVSDTSLSIFSWVVLILGIMLMLFHPQKI